jgi:hypothetical protein
MWDTTRLNVKSFESQVERSGIPHLAKNERDMGHPSFVVRRVIDPQTAVAREA